MESKYSFENEAVAAVLLPNKNKIDFAKDAVVEAEKIRYKNPQEARRLLLHAAEIYLETAKTLTDPTLCTSLLYLAHSYSIAASQLSLKTAITEPSTEYLSHKNEISDTNSYQGRISITNNIINKPKNKPKSAPVPLTKTPIEDMFELEDRLAALSMSFSMATSKSYINASGIGSKMDGSITNDCQSKIESYLYLSDYVTAYPNKITNNVASSAISPEETKSTIALPNNTTTTITTNNHTIDAPTISPFPSHQFFPTNTSQWSSSIKSEKGIVMEDSQPSPNTTGKSVVGITDAAPAIITTSAKDSNSSNNNQCTITTTQLMTTTTTSICTGNELRLLQSIQRLGDENLVLIQRLESLSNMEESLLKLQKEMKDLISEYKKRFKKIRNILQTTNNNNNNNNNNNTNNNNNNSNNNNSNNNSNAPSSSYDPQDKMRISQLEGVMFQLMKRLEQAKIDSDKKDEIIRNLKQKNKSMKHLLTATSATTSATTSSSPIANNSQSSHSSSTASSSSASLSAAATAANKSSINSTPVVSSSSSKYSLTPPPPLLSIATANNTSSASSSTSGTTSAGNSRQGCHSSRSSPRSLNAGPPPPSTSSSTSSTSSSSSVTVSSSSSSLSGVNYGYHHSSTATLQTSLHRSRTSTAVSSVVTSLKSPNTTTSKA